MFMCYHLSINRRLGNPTLGTNLGQRTIAMRTGCMHFVDSVAEVLVIPCPAPALRVLDLAEESCAAVHRSVVLLLELGGLQGHELQGGLLLCGGFGGLLDPDILLMV